MRQVNCASCTLPDLLVLGGKREGPRPLLFADKGSGNQTNHAVCHSVPFAHIRLEILTNHI